MKRHKRLMWWACWLALLPCLIPSDSWANPDPALAAVAPQKTVDLELQAGGVVRGNVLNPAGQPAAGGVIRAFRGDMLVTQTKVDAAGRFELRGLQPGACHLQLLSAMQPCRLWAPGTAPPKSPQELLLVTGQPTARGQQEIRRLLSNPLFIGLAIAAAVAIPLAVHDDSGS